MDFRIADRRRKRRSRRLILAAGGTVTFAVVLIGLGRIVPAAPDVQRSVVWTGVVERGGFLHQVRGPGSLQVPPEQVRWLAAETRGRVEERRVLPGTPVEADTVLLVLSNPELVEQTREAELELHAQEADLRRLVDQTRSDLLDQQNAARQLAFSSAKARRRAEADKRLSEAGLVGELIHRRSHLTAEELATRHSLEEERLAILSDSTAAQIASKEATVAQYRAALELRRRQLAALTVRAGRGGVLLEVPVEAGQEVSPGHNLARVADPRELQAVLRIAETQARNVEPGQSALVDTRNGVVEGVVSRVDPAVRDGTVAVDIRLEGKLPRGARPDLSVDGTIELERIQDTLHVGRPAYGQPGSAVGLFRIAPDGQTAVRVSVELGRASANRIEVLNGLAEGDEIILSDTSVWDTWDQIRLR
ncbi:MAG: efflux RND transporter periplasmic adaptor subunit [Acidobacteria bacterium]|nr:efflux RND transporter periplasmic adaptor subunit [Acidobacteriota bacterium]